MKVTPVVLLLLLVLLVATAQAQNLPSKPVPQPISDPLSPVGFGPFVRPYINRNTFIPQGMVWWSDGHYWYARDEGSCDKCGRPMTFRQAALDKKALALTALHIGLQVADIFSIRRCDNRGYCREGIAPFLGDGSFKEQMALKMPIAAFTLISTAYSRKGDYSLHIGGWKSWWYIQVLYDAGLAAAIIANLKQQHSI